MVAAGFVTTLVTASPAAAAATVTFGAITKTDGTATFDGTDMHGNDTGATNGIVRTLDLVTYELTIGNSGLGNDINQTTITSTLPVGMVWAALDATCRVSGAIPAPVPPSTISADRRSIVCNIGSRLAGSLVRTSLQAYPQATVPDGTTKTATFGLDYNDPGSANARLSASGGSASVIVSAGKPFDLSHNDNVSPVFGLQYTTSTALVATSSPVSGTVTDGASPLSGAVVGLYDSSNNPKIDPTTSLPYQTTTDGSGNYSFASVTNGVTRIRVISGVPGGDVPSATMSYLVTIQGQAIHANFDYITPTLGTTTGAISGTLFNDTNVDGVLGSETGVDLVGLTLTGFDSTGNPVTRTTTTDSSGAYSFSVPPSGANGYKIVTTGRKVAFYLAVLTSEETIFVGDAESKTVNIPWSTDTDRGKLFVTRFPIALKGPNGGKGISSAAGPVTWTENVPAGTVVNGCGRQGQTVNNNPLPNGSGGGAFAVPNSGTWTCTQPGGPGTPISMTINGADTSGLTFPTRSWNNATAIPANDRFLATGWIGISQPDPGCGVSIGSRTVNSTNMAATTISGDALTDPISATDTMTAAAGTARNCPSLPGNNGFVGHDKRFTKDDSHAWAGVTNDLNSTNNLHNTQSNPQVPNGSPFGTYLQTYNNSGLWDATDIISCDKFDLTRFKLLNRPGVTPATPFSLVVTNPQTPFANRLLHQYATTGSYDAASATSGAFVIEIGMGTPYASLTAQTNGSCTDSGLTWQAWDPATPMSQSDLDSAVAFRMRVKAFQPGDQMVVRAEMITQASPATSPYAGAGLTPVPNPDPTLANTMGYLQTYPAGVSAQANFNRYADPANGIVRVNNYDPNTASAVTSAVLGDTVAQRLDVSVSGVFPNSGLSLRDVTVVDTIPAGLTYIPGSASVTPTSVVAGSGGTTVMTWNLGNIPTDSVLTTINFQVKVGDSLSNGTVLTTTAVVSSIDDNTPVATRTDIHQVQITSPAEFRIFKTADRPTTEPDDTLSYRLGYKNLSVDAIATQDFVDVLPYVGDARGTAFAGTYTLDPNQAAPIVPANNDDVIYVTTATPGGINRDPAASSNTVPYASSGTQWCVVPADLGTAGCPTDIHDAAITAFRVQSAHSMIGTDPARYIGVSLRATGDAVGNTFDNNFSARAQGLSTFVQSGIAAVTVARSTVSNFVWHDLNRNGRQDSGEPGIPGVTVTLTGHDYRWNGSAYEQRNDYDATPLTAVTDSSGLYSFTGLNHGEYRLAFPPTATIGSNVGTLTTKDAATDITDSDADAMSGETDNFCVGGAPDTTSSVDCTDFSGLATTQTQWDAGYFAYGNLGDFVWDDLNGNGVQNSGEPGLAGWNVDLIGPGPDGLMGTGDETVDATTTTDGSGHYLFPLLVPGPYQVQITPQGTYVATKRDIGSDSLDSDINPASNRIDVVVKSAQNTQAANLSFDAGYYQPGGIGDFVWVDDNADGVQDPGELGLDDVRVDLLDNSSNPVLNSLGQPIFTTTGDDPNTVGTQVGYYSFSNLSAGTYRVKFTAPFGYSITTPGSHSGTNLSGTATDSDPDRSGVAVITVISGDPFNADVDAGMFKPVAIGSRVWADTDGNGVQDPGELGVAGVTVRLLDETGAAVLNTSGAAYVTTTDAGGRYSFANLFPKASSTPAAYYRVRFDLPSGYKWTGAAPITAPDQTSVPTSGVRLTDSDTTWTTRTQSNAKSGKIYLSQSETNDSVDAGIYRPAQIGNYVWKDDNGDGIQDSIESGFTGVTVSLLQRTSLGIDGLPGTDDDVYSAANNDDGGAISSVVTGSSGAYSFTNLAAGTYKVRFDWPGSAHVAATVADASGNAIDDVDSDIHPTGTARRAETGPVALLYGDTNSNVDAGFSPTAALGNRIWEDLNGNGVQDSGEPGVAGADVTIWTRGVDNTFGTGDDVQVTADANSGEYGTAGVITTGSDGAYLFDDLAPGTYQVRVHTPGVTWMPTQVTHPGDPLVSDTDSDLGALLGDGRTAPFASVTLSPGDRPLTLDGGLVRPVAIGDLVFEDHNGNGIQDSGDLGIAGAHLTLWTAGVDTLFGTGDDVAVLSDRDGATFGTAGTITTNSSGAYAFDDLLPGIYQVRIVTPTGTVFTQAGAGSDRAVDSDAIRTTPSTGNLGSVTLASNQSTADLDAGVYTPASIGNFVWVDGNGNGIQDSGEAGLAGATVTLRDAAGTAVTTDALGATISSITTTSSGAYSFPDLIPGVYRVQVLLPSGYLHAAVGAGTDVTVDSDIDATTHRSPTVTLASGETTTAIDAGAYRPVGIGNHIWNDLNANGVQDSGETTGIPGVTVELLDPSDTVVASTVSDASGDYQFTRLGADQADSSAALLPPGTYHVRFHRPTGWVPSPSAGTDRNDANNSDVVFADLHDATGDTDPIALAENATELDVDAGFFQPASIGDRVWEDLNGDGIQDSGEPGLDNVTVSLVDAAGDPAVDAYGNAVAPIVTGSDGEYLFDNLRPGQYRVTISYDNSVWVPSGEDRGADNTVDSDFDASGQGQLLTLVSGDDVTGNDAGLYHTILIGDRVFEDRNGNGIQDSGEAGVAGIPVALDGVDGDGNVVHRTTVSDFTGHYEFRDLAPGTYHLTITPPTGWTIAPLDRGSDDTIDSDFDPSTHRSADTIITSQEIDRTWDAGLIQGPLLSGHVYVDGNNSGVRDASETGLGSVTIELTGHDVDGNVVHRTTTTDPTGFYLFINLPTSDEAGYAITETQPSGLLDGTDHVGSAGGADTAADAFSGIVVRSGTIGETYDFGELRPSSIAGIVYVDTTGNGLADAGEPRLEGVQVTLTGTDDHAAAVSLSTTTASDGTYQFTGLRPGTYQVAETQPSGYNDGIDRAGTAGGSVAVNDVASGMVITQNTHATGYLFGEVASSPTGFTSVEGTVWRDPNRNGAHDGSETGGVAGVTITLKTVDGTTVGTTTTDANGHYVFTGFVPGNYLISESQPTGWLSTSPDDLGSMVTPVVIGAAGVRNQDFFEDRGRITGSVYADDNTSGTRDTGETGISGVTVTLTGTDIDGNPVSRTTFTTPSGNYRFNDVAESDSSGYTITETQPAGWSDGVDAAGTVDGVTTGTAGNDVITGVVLGVGGIGTAYTFGEIRAAGGSGTTFVSGHVYLDGNHDGNLDPGESGLGGVTVQLLDNNGATVGSTVTGTDGAYSFVGLTPGTYSLREIQPTGYTSTSPDDLGPLALTTSGLANQDFGERLPGSGTGSAWVSGLVYGDRDADGTPDAGEPGIAGVTITLTDAFSAVVGTTVTGPGGTYRFDNLAPGDYSVTETQPLGMGSSTANALGPVSVPIGGLDNQNFGDTFSSLAGSVFVDDGNDGLRLSEEIGIGGTTVTLSGNDAAGNPVSRIAVTDVNGDYLFGDLLAGTYTITETQPAGHADGLDTAGTEGGGVANDVLSAIHLPVHTDGIHYWFGEGAATITNPSGTTWVTGVVWYDANRDSNMDPGETPLAGVRVDLRDHNGNVVGTVLTEADGSYLFLGLTPGADYSVTEVDPVGYASSLNPGTAAFTAGAADEATGGPNFGDTLSTLSGSVFNDADRDGVHDSGEPGIAGVLVTLTGTDAHGTTVSQTAYTGPDGSYRFTALLGGTYAIAETQPAGYDDGAEIAGSIASDRSTNDVQDAIVLPAGTDGTNFDFGELLVITATTSITGQVFVDRGADGASPNGLYESGEPHLGGVTLILRDVNGVIVATTVSGPDGSYRFDGLTPGTYSVEKLQPTGYGISTPSVLSTLIVPIDGLDNVDFGVTLASITGLVFNDINDNGTQASDEPGIAGVTIVVSGVDAFGNAVERTTVTDADGRFVVADLLASDPTGYTVTETQPDGWSDGIDVIAVDGTLAPDQFNGVVLAPGEGVDAGTFGEFVPATIGDKVWSDDNGNGIQDTGEAPVDGLSITLVGETNAGTASISSLSSLSAAGSLHTAAVNASTTTDANGIYHFGDIRPGDYHIEFHLGNRIATYRDVGSNRAADSNGDVNGRTETFTMRANRALGDTSQNRSDIDLGAPEPASISGKLFRDTNGNGILDGDESSATCTSVQLVAAGPDGTFDTADDPAVVHGVPDADGHYSFPSILPGKYRVESDCTDPKEATVHSGENLTDVNLPMRTSNTPIGDLPMRTSNTPIGDLPFTGAQLALLTLWGFALVGGGFIIVSTTRRRRRRTL